MQYHKNTVTLENELIEIGFNNQQLRKTYAFYHLVKSNIKTKKKQFIDLCARNGLAGFFFNYYGCAEETLFVDIKKPGRFVRLENILIKYSLKFRHKQQDINNPDFDLNASEDSCIIAVHPCGKLCDRVMELGLENRIPFAIMTCCHENDFLGYALKNPPDPKPELYEEKADYFDLIRVRYVQEHGWKCGIIPPLATEEANCYTEITGPVELLNI